MWLSSLPVAFFARGSVLTHCVFISDPGNEAERTFTKSWVTRNRGSCCSEGRSASWGCGRAETSQSSAKANAECFVWDRTASCSVTARGWLVGKQLCQTGAGSPSEQQDAYESAVCPCACANQQHPVLCESVLADKWSDCLPCLWAWRSSGTSQSRENIDKLEDVWRRATGLVRGLQCVMYEEILWELRLCSLKNSTLEGGW